MFKNFNWGHGIFVFYVCFVAAVVTALVASFSVDHSLVVEDYYAKDLAYQSQYTKTQNGLKSDRVSINNDKENQALIIDFLNDEEIKGSIDFYRPSDKSKDFKIEIEEKATSVDTKKMLPGKWIVKIDWTENGEPFYTEKMVYL